MVKDMRDVLMESDGPADDHQNNHVHIGGQHLAALVEGDEDEDGPAEVNLPQYPLLLSVVFNALLSLFDNRPPLSTADSS